MTSTGYEAPVALDDDGIFQSDGVALIDFEDGTGACTQGDDATNLELRGSVQAGTYTGIKLRIGVPLSANHQDPTTQPSPLNESSLVWSWNAGTSLRWISRNLETRDQR